MVGDNSSHDDICRLPPSPGQVLMDIPINDSLGCGTAMKEWAREVGWVGRLCKTIREWRFFNNKGTFHPYPVGYCLIYVSSLSGTILKVDVTEL